MTSSYTNRLERRKRGCLASANKVPTFRRKHCDAGFTMVETIVAVSLIAITFTSFLAALTRMNSIASISRNYTGAYVAAEKRMDWILSVGPFNPKKAQIPEDKRQNPDLTWTTLAKLAPGTYTETDVPIYNDPKKDPVTAIFQLLQPGATPTFSGMRTTVVTDVSPASNAPPYIYRVTVTVTYTYRSRNYSFSMSTLRTSDT